MAELIINNLNKTYKKGAVKALDDFSITLTPAKRDKSEKFHYNR